MKLKEGKYQGIVRILICKWVISFWHLNVMLSNMVCSGDSCEMSMSNFILIIQFLLMIWQMNIGLRLKRNFKMGMIYLERINV